MYFIPIIATYPNYHTSQLLSLIPITIQLLYLNPIIRPHPSYYTLSQLFKLRQLQQRAGWSTGLA